MIIGYELRDEAGGVVNRWVGKWGVTPGIPNPLILPNGDHVCAASSNTDYSGYTLVPIEQDVPTASDFTLQPYQFFAMLDYAGLTDTANAAIAAIPDPRERAVAKARLNKESIFVRDDPLLVQLISAANLTPEQIDTLWLEAKDW